MLRYVLPVMVIILAGCTPPPIIVTENPPHYAMVQQTLGLNDADHTVRVQVDNAADDACQKFNRSAKLPAYENKCVYKHFLLGSCITHQYTYECIPTEAD